MRAREDEEGRRYVVFRVDHDPATRRQIRETLGDPATRSAASP